MRTRGKVKQKKIVGVGGSQGEGEKERDTK